MATEAQLMEGIRRADKAGDTEGVRVLGKALIAMRKPKAKSKDTSALTGFIQGAIKPIDNLSSALSSIPYVGPAIDSASEALGMPTTAQAVQRNDAARQGNTRKGYQTLGNIAGTLPTMALPGGALVQGGVSGALLSDKKNLAGVALDAGIGGASQGVASGVLKGAGTLLAPVASKAGKALYDAGIPLTLGQLAKQGKGAGSKIAAGVESTMRRLPIAKQIVQNAEDRGYMAAYQSVLKRTGVDVPDSIAPGHEALDYIGNKLSSKYQQLLPKLNIVADPKLNAGLAQVGSKVKGVAPSAYKQFQSILKTTGLSDTGGINITGAKLQQADRVLRVEAERFRKGGPNDTIIAEGLEGVREQLRGLAYRQNPQYAKELGALNKNYREFAVARKAAGDPNSTSGIFSPAQYSRAAKGSRSNQFQTRSANQLLTNRSPDSGTAETAALGQLGAIAASGGLGAFASPYLAIPAAAAAGASSLYTTAGQKLINRLAFAPRSKVAKGAGTTLKNLGKYATGPAPALIAAQDGN